MLHPPGQLVSLGAVGWRLGGGVPGRSRCENCPYFGPAFGQDRRNPRRRARSHIIFIHLRIAGPAQNPVRMRVVVFGWSRPPRPPPPPPLCLHPRRTSRPGRPAPTSRSRAAAWTRPPSSGRGSRTWSLTWRRCGKLFQPLTQDAGAGAGVHAGVGIRVNESAFCRKKCEACRCLNKVPKQRPRFEDVVSDLAQVRLAASTMVDIRCILTDKHLHGTS